MVLRLIKKPSKPWFHRCFHASITHYLTSAWFLFFKTTGMCSVTQIIAFVLLAIWMPATQHCAFDAVVTVESHLCETVCNHDTGGSHEDACTVVESGDYTLSATLAHVPAPSLTTLACLACLHARILFEATPLAPPAWSTDDPAGWVPQWAFTARAALPARAPNLT